MYKLKFTNPVLPIIPVLVVIPTLIIIIKDMHLGGLSTLLDFFISALTPSIEANIIQSSLHGLQITFALAIISWCISIILGVLLGLLSSCNFYKICELNIILASIVRRFLTIPRSIHEVIWGILLLQIFGLSPWIAIIAISIPYSSLMARVFADQIDAIDNKEMIAIRSTGASNFAVMITSLLPKIIPIIETYGFYRLECALRGATLLGIFGLGGIGTELQLSILSLRFHEIWTSLWFLFISIYILERLIEYIQHRKFYFNNVGFYIILFILVIFSLSTMSIYWLNSLDLNMFTRLDFLKPNSPNINNIIVAFKSLKLYKLIYETLLLTFLSSFIAIGLPPLLLLMFPSKSGEKILSLIWVFCRLFPPPLTILLLLLCTTPSISVAALALGIQNMGVLGRLLKENINKQGLLLYQAITSTSANINTAWLYGKFAPQSIRYLTYSIYRSDIILRETIVVGVVGGVGLGWQLRESLSSFAWEEVIVLTITFASLTLITEFLTERLQKQIHFSSKQKNINYAQ